MEWTERIALASAPVIGAVIAYVDSRPTWDDTGVTAAGVLVACAVLAAPARRPWVIACAVGGWIPLIGILGSNNYGSLIALGFAFAGAYAGMYVRRILAA